MMSACFRVGGDISAGHVECVSHRMGDNRAAGSLQGEGEQAGGRYESILGFPAGPQHPTVDN